MGTPDLPTLLSDPDARLDFVIRITDLWDETDTLVTYWYSLSGWIDPPDGPAAQYCKPLLQAPFAVENNVDILRPQESFGSINELVFINDHQDYPGEFDSFSWYSIDDISITVFAVGMLGDGTPVTLTDVLSTPFFSLVGEDIPEVSSGLCVLHVRDESHTLGTALQPDTFSTSCLQFTGVAGAEVNFGDNFDVSGSFAISIWFTCDDPTAVQYLLHKDSGPTGYFIGISTVNSASIGVTIRGQVPDFYQTAAGLIRAGVTTRVDISNDDPGGTLRIDLDGVTVLTTSLITGSPTNSTTSLNLGLFYKGRIHRVVWWNVAESLATMQSQGRVPIIGTEANLQAYLPLNEGVGPTVHDRKSLSSITGTIGNTDATTWATGSIHLQSLAGQNLPLVIGTVLRAPVTQIDPAKQIGILSHPLISEAGVASAANIFIAELQSNHTAISTANYTYDKSNGTVTLTSGTVSNNSATVTANNTWGTALLIGSTSTCHATINSPTGSRTLVIQYRPDRTLTSAGYLIGWQTSALAGCMILRLTTGSINALNGFAINDSLGIVNVNGPSLVEGQTYTLALELNTLSGFLSIYVNGVFFGSTGLSGTWTTVRTAFAIGDRADTSTGQALGRLDEAAVFNRALSAAEHIAAHNNPLTGAESGLVRLWHLDDATTPLLPSTSAAAAVGGTALTLTNITWTSGRSCAADLARWCYYRKGYVLADLDAASWAQCVTDAPYDCGWYLSKGEITLDIIRLLLGGLNFVPYRIGTVIYIKRVRRPTGTAEIIFDGKMDVRLEDIPGEIIPAVWQHRVEYAKNDIKQDAANVLVPITDPERREYASQDYRLSTKDDASIRKTSTGARGRFPRAMDLQRSTALIYKRDADLFATFLLAIYRDGWDVKQVPSFLLAGRQIILTECSYINVDHLDMEHNTFIVTATSGEEELATIVVARPAKYS